MVLGEFRYGWGGRLVRAWIAGRGVFFGVVVRRAGVHFRWYVAPGGRWVEA